MPDEREKIPLDARLLSDAIIELNISRRNVAIYPKDHPSVEKSLNRAYIFLRKLFELRPEITLAIAKDVLIIDDYYLDKKNPVYKEFAAHLSRLNIAYVTFITGLTIDELYKFHKLFSEKFVSNTYESFQERFKESHFFHIKIGFIDYDAFAFEEGKTSKEKTDTPLWERYVYGLLEGTLQTEDISEEMREIPPLLLSQLLNKGISNSIKEEAYDKVITTYIRRSSEASFSSADLKRLIEFINNLKPELKKQFLSSAIKTISRDYDTVNKTISGISVDEVIELLNIINEQKMVIPDALKNILDKLSKLPQDGSENIVTQEGCLIVDDIFLSPDIVMLFSGNFDAFVSDTYRKEIQKLLNYDTSKIISSKLKDSIKEYDEVYVDRDFNQIILEIISSKILSEEEYKYFIDIIKGHIDEFLWTGQFKEIFKTFKVLESNIRANKFYSITSEVLEYYHSKEFIAKLIDSFRVMGRQNREEAWLICEYYDDKIIPILMDALIEESSQTVRKFLLSLLKNFGDKVISEALKRLGDSRWFIKRNMIYILGQCTKSKVLPHIRPYCRHENHKVSIEAIKCLLEAGDSYGVEVVKDFLNSGSKELVDHAVALAGNFRIRDVVDDLISMLKKRGIGGTDLYEKIPIVKALGEIRDSKALDILRELLSEKSIIFKGATEKLKEEIYKSLKNYSLSDIKDFIEKGLKSKNKYIREESLRLRKRIEQDGYN